MSEAIGINHVIQSSTSRRQWAPERREQSNNPSPGCLGPPLFRQRNSTLDVVQDLTNEYETVLVNNSNKKKFLRKRVKNSKGSTDNVAKKARAEGAKEAGRAGITIKPRVMKSGCLANCRKACFNNISNDYRQLAFDQYYELADKNWVIRIKSSHSSDVEASITKRTSDVVQYDFRNFLSVLTHSEIKIKRYERSHGR
ncbi:uncharacterized protein LOC117168154 [Belonocnema kinseyi]|uniref:uncharacterized protein LOC117168154 n=1 Tax=Belonocnema kinseyi TaxID=2817044 RepID=UPI00143CC681|nr:uncharacterized protein LOC117168154 [Belonocnema kinseyi]XP_033209473.1 uncharacterized protein LOC117168154 [Belonocnema kinseyi]